MLVDVVHLNLGVDRHYEILGVDELWAATLHRITSTTSVGMVLAYSSQAVVRASAVNGVSSTVCTVDVFSSATDSAGF